MDIFDRIFGPLVDNAPVDPEVPCHRDLPTGYIEIKEKYRKRAARKIDSDTPGPQHLFWCPGCHGWIPEWPSGSRENVLNLEALSGRSGSVYYCRRCHARSISNAVDGGENGKEHTKARVIGCKLLRQDGSSLNANGYGSVSYPVGEWIDVPGNGAYVSIMGNLFCGGNGPLLAYFECKGPTGIFWAGAECFRQVRRLPDAVPDKIGLSLKTEIACHAPGLDAGQRMTLARDLLKPQRGEVSYSAPDLSFEQRLELIEEMPTPWRGFIACHTPGLSSEHRVRLAIEASPEWCGDVARMGRGLSSEQRTDLAKRTTPERRGMAAYHCRIIDLSVDHRIELAKTSTSYWCGYVAYQGSGLSPERRLKLAQEKIVSPVYRDSVIKKWGSEVKEKTGCS